jgi:hypothetical protein
MITVPIIIDFSSSGVGPESYPIEVGFSGRHGEGWCSLIRPEAQWAHWDTSTARVHKIPREVLMQRGNGIQYVAEQLNFFLHGQTVHSEDWGLDFVWMEKIFETAGIKPKFKLNDLYEIIQDKQSIVWDETKAKIIKELCVERRRASGDARVLQLTWLRTYDAVNGGSISKQF